MYLIKYTQDNVELQQQQQQQLMNGIAAELQRGINIIKSCNQRSLEQKQQQVIMSRIMMMLMINDNDNDDNDDKMIMTIR